MLARISRTSTLIAVGLALFTLSVSVSPAQATGPRVVGGGGVTFADVPWQVLFLMNNESVCGGSIVSATHVVSAAHCFDQYPTSQVKAWTGISRMEDRGTASELPIAEITLHPDYDATTFANDIALVTLSTPVSPELGAISIGLPTTQDATTWPATGTSALVSGWGETDPATPVAANQLQAANVEVMAGPEAATCGEYGGAYIGSLQICAGVDAGGIDACEGDSGGPLTVFIDGEPILAGVSSTGVECGAVGYPGLYVRTTTYVPWLESLGVDVSTPGGSATVAVPGSASDGEPANFQVGETYSRAVFAEYAGLKALKSRLKVTGGKACTQVKQSVRVDQAGKCRITVTRGKKKVSLVVTIYAN